jgi:hypothetical protein
MTADDVLTDNRWMTISKQCGSLSVQRTPLLAELLDTTPDVTGMTLLVGSPSSAELAHHLGTSSSAGEVLLNVDARTKALRVTCPTALRGVGAEDYCLGDNIAWARRRESKDCLSLAHIYARLLGPFTHVVCVFISSFSSRAELGSFLSSWVQSTIPITQTFMTPYSAAARPRLVVITEEELSTGSEHLGELKASLQAIVLEQTGFSLNEAFSSISVKGTLTEVGLLRRRRYTKMTTLLTDECAAARKDFERLNMLYDAHNIVDLFSSAYDCLLSDTTFNAVAASRAWGPVPSSASQQIAKFLSDFSDEDSLETFALPYLVSAIRSNAYPAASHRKYLFLLVCLA